MKRITLVALSVCFFIQCGYAQSYIRERDDVRLAVEPEIRLKTFYFSLKDVKLLDGPFKRALEADKRWLFKIDPDRYLHRFHANAGLPVKGEIYGGWENTTQSGHTFGHYISALSMLYAATGDQDVKERIDYIIDELARCQDIRKTGYVGGIPNEDQIWTDIANGNIRALPFDLNGLWVPWYNLHKLWAGLLDAYLYGGNEQAKNIVVKLTDWTANKFANLTEAQWQEMLICESGGMFDVLMSVYALTGEERHLQIAEKFYHNAVLDPLSQQKDDLNGKHANTQIPKVIGAARAYQLTQDEKYKTIASFFWETVVHQHSYVTGGNSDFEHFGEPGQLSGRLSSNTTETCNTYNMLKLTRHLFSWNPDARYADYYERALYNHILSSQHPETGMVCYFVPLGARSRKTYSTVDDSFWCCVGTGYENHVKYGENIYAHKDDSLYVNLFIASELNWKHKGMTVRQKTLFPEQEQSTLVITAAKPTKATFLIRYPSWATAGYTVKVNGKKQKIKGAPGSYVAITRKWKTGDKIAIETPFELYQEKLLGDKHKYAFLHGPIVLSGELEDEQRNPVFLTKKRPVREWVHRVNEQHNVFQTQAGLPEDVSLVPFYKKHEGAYSVYFDNYTPAEWEENKVDYEAQLAYEEKIKRLTVDYFRPNEQQQEIDHNFKGERVSRGEGTEGRKWCDTNGGWFSFELNVDGTAALELMLTYWGSDGGPRKFDILIDEEFIATEQLTAKNPGKFIDQVYTIPTALIQGKDRVTVKLRAHQGNKAGGLFGARILKKEK